MFWDRVAGIYDLFANIYNAKTHRQLKKEIAQRILPKKTSFKALTQEKVDLVMDHINSYKRKKLSDRSPHQLFSFLYGDDVTKKLHAHNVDADEINLTPELLK